ncbi:Rha family transcriptional regulator [Chromatium okenii]|uniref:Rha family transcriptional regulator n=1 Tax=Chromatium okenii TaxID=61644 RepID=UPI0026EDA451|nr:Rha family transcriptional regulator [Chromatium okenii]MBV5308064.1 Rha family transcriptional regulator [Chromatium okenii]
METRNTLSVLPVTMTSREIADLVEKRHDSVKRTIDTLVERGVIQLPQVVIAEKINGLGLIQKSEHYVFTHEHKRDTFVVVAQLSPEFTAKLVDRWQELEAAFASTLQQSSIQPDTYTLPYQPAMKVQIVELAMRSLRVSETSKIRMLAKFIESEGFNSDFLPDYVDEPLVRAITPLLKGMGHSLGSKVANTVNPALEAMGILEHLSRKSTGGKIKQFWSLTEEGLQYGRNETSPNNPRETQPLFFVNRFPELLTRLEAHLDHKILPPAQ